MLVIDVSGSMQAEDVEPTRLEAAQEVVREFLKGLPKRFQVGVVAFSETGRGRRAGDRRPAARDRRDRLPLPAARHGDRRRARARRRGRARRRRRQTRAPERPAAILLLSDGSQTEGVLLPLEGAARAKSFRIPVYTIALGTPEGVVEFNRFGGTRIIPVPPDPATLRQIAAQTGGRFYEAESVGDLREAYEQDGVAREQGRAQAGGHVRVPRPAGSCSCSRRRRSPSSRSRGCRERRLALARRARARAGGLQRRRRRVDTGHDRDADTVTVTRPTATEPRDGGAAGGPTARSPTRSSGCCRRSSTCARSRSAAARATAPGSCSTGAGSSSRTTTSSRARRASPSPSTTSATRAPLAGHGDRDRARARPRRDPRRRRTTSCRSRLRALLVAATRRRRVRGRLPARASAARP